MIPWAALAYPFGPLLGVKGGGPGGGGGLKFEWRIESSDAGYSKGAEKDPTQYWELHCQEGACTSCNCTSA